MSFYYLHTNGDLIWKKFEPEYDSPFVKKIWPCDVTDRMNAWKIVLEALALKAQHERIRQLCIKWKMGWNDLKEMLFRVKKPSQLMKDGLTVYIRDIQGYDLDKFWDNFSQGIIPELHEDKIVQPE